MVVIFLFLFIFFKITSKNSEQGFQDFIIENIFGSSSPKKTVPTKTVHTAQTTAMEPGKVVISEPSVAPLDNYQITPSAVSAEGVPTYSSPEVAINPQANVYSYENTLPSEPVNNITATSQSEDAYVPVEDPEASIPDWLK